MLRGWKFRESFQVSVWDPQNPLLGMDVSEFVGDRIISKPLDKEYRTQCGSVRIQPQKKANPGIAYAAIEKYHNMMLVDGQLYSIYTKGCGKNETAVILPSGYRLMNITAETPDSVSEIPVSIRAQLGTKVNVMAVYSGGVRSGAFILDEFGDQSVYLPKPLDHINVHMYTDSGNRVFKIANDVTDQEETMTPNRKTLVIKKTKRSEVSEIIRNENAVLVDKIAGDFEYHDLIGKVIPVDHTTYETMRQWSCMHILPKTNYYKEVLAYNEMRRFIIDRSYIWRNSTTSTRENICRALASIHEEKVVIQKMVQDQNLW